MKRFHVHVHVTDLPASIAFYSRLFAAQPVRLESDYAKWMIEDPRINFAISTRGGRPGIDHLGMQADSPAELDELRARAAAAGAAVRDEGQTTCCYARSAKHWLEDPQGIAWEHFQTMGDIAVFNEGAQKAPEQAEHETAAAPAACCAPAAGRGTPLSTAVTPAKSCC